MVGSAGNTTCGKFSANSKSVLLCCELHCNQHQRKCL